MGRKYSLCYWYFINFCSTNHLDAFLKGYPCYYNDDKDIPILETFSMERKRLYSVEDIVQLLLHPNLKSSMFVATKVPTMVCRSMSSIVNLDCLDAQHDILADDMGVWRNNGVGRSSVDITFENDLSVKLVKRCSSKDVHSTKTYTLKRIYRVHTTDQTLRKITAFLYGKQIYNKLNVIKRVYVSRDITDSGACLQNKGFTLSILININQFSLSPVEVLTKS